MVDSIDDLSRQVYCLLGIPVDNIGMVQTVDRVYDAARKKAPFLLATPNINFLVNAMLDESFRQTVVSSDLSIPDGAWLVRLGRLVGIPLKDRVAGADILEALRLKYTSKSPLEIFIFGGSDAAGQRAREVINERNNGLRCVGSLNPGFGSVEQMSAEDSLAPVNSSGADFLLVALGAIKGQTWLHKNHSQLNIPVRAHLGATINFYSGAIKRAPRLLQKWGLEWAWRIKEEPSLWRRYAFDGLYIALVFLSRVAPLLFWIFYLHLRKRFIGEHLSIDQSSSQGRRVITLRGALTEKNVEAIASVLRSALGANEELVIDLSGARAVDARFAGLLLMFQKTLARHGRSPHFADASFFIRWVFGLYGFEIPSQTPEFYAAPANAVEVVPAG